jgi:uncharacterized protein YecE (DUF72 family)
MNLPTPPTLHSGLSGIELPVPKYQFPSEYQKSTRLTYYATFFNTIEVNSSFYKIPMARTVEKWASSVNNQFKFTFKLFREVTHCKNMEFDPAHIKQFMDVINHIGDKRGCILVQFPPSLLENNIHQLDKLFNTIKTADPDNHWKVAVEFRNKGWYNDDVYELLKTHNASLVIHDIQKSATPFIHTSSDFFYMRFHGPTGNYRGSYTDAFLHEYAGYIKEWLAERKTGYVYFNNTAGDAFRNLIAFNGLVTS